MHGRNRLEILVKDHLSPVWSHRIVFQMIFEIVEGDALDGGLASDRRKGEPFDSAQGPPFYPVGERSRTTAQGPPFYRNLLDRLSSGRQEYDSIHQVAVDFEVLIGTDGDVDDGPFDSAQGPPFHPVGERSRTTVGERSRTIAQNDMEVFRNLRKGGPHPETPVKRINLHRCRGSVQDKTTVFDSGPGSRPLFPPGSDFDLFALLVAIRPPVLEPQRPPDRCGRLGLDRSQPRRDVSVRKQGLVKTGITPEPGRIRSVGVQKSHSLVNIKDFRLPVKVGHPISFGVFREISRLKGRDLLGINGGRNHCQ